MPMSHDKLIDNGSSGKDESLYYMLVFFMIAALGIMGTHTYCHILSHIVLFMMVHGTPY